MAGALQEKWKKQVQVLAASDDSTSASPSNDRKRKRQDNENLNNSKSKKQHVKPDPSSTDSPNPKSPIPESPNSNNSPDKVSSVQKSHENIKREGSNNLNQQTPSAGNESKIESKVQVAVTSKPLVGNTSDKTRNRSQVMLAEAIGERTSEDQLHPIDVAQEVELELFDMYQDIKNKEYGVKFRSLYTNVKDVKNASLRYQLLSGQLTGKRLAHMSYEELANPELKSVRKEIEKKKNEERMIGKQSEGTCELFTCGKCKQKKTSYYQMQTRGADEPMTVFITCAVCGNRWKQ